MLSLTLLDISTILGLSLDGEEIPHYGTAIILDYNITHKNVVVYNKFVKTNRKIGEATEDEHAAFLLCWICKYVVFTVSFEVILEFVYYFSLSLPSRTSNLATLMLTSIYQNFSFCCTKMYLRDRRCLPYLARYRLCNCGSTNTFQSLVCSNWMKWPKESPHTRRPTMCFRLF
jgi:hypothetical protein